MSLVLSVIIPAYKEEESLKMLGPRINKALSGQGFSYEVLVLDTLQPMDNTAEICRQNNLKYINRKNGNYYGDAIRSGIEKAQGEYLVFMDGDGSHDPEFILELFKPRKDFDVVIASRYVDGGATENSFALILMSRIVNLIYALVLNLKCKDVSNSFKLYHSNQLKALELHSNNFDIVEEILYKLNKNSPGLRIKELPYTFKRRMFGETKRNLIAFIFSYFFTLLKLRLRG